MEQQSMNSEQHYNVHTAEVEIAVLLQGVMVGGNVDSEVSDLKNLIERMKGGEITPIEAVRQAQELVGARIER